MATNPPIVIGPFSNVPAPGSGVKSDWPQQISRLVGDRHGIILTDTPQAIANATPTDVTWSTEVSDPDGWFIPGATIVTVPAGKGGRYLITYEGRWSNLPGDKCEATIKIGGSAAVAAAATIGGAFVYGNLISFLRTLVVGETIGVAVYQNSSATINLTSRLEICPVGL